MREKSVLLRRPYCGFGQSMAFFVSSQNVSRRIDHFLILSTYSLTFNSTQSRRSSPAVASPKWCSRCCKATMPPSLRTARRAAARHSRWKATTTRLVYEFSLASCSECLFVCLKVALFFCIFPAALFAFATPTFFLSLSLSPKPPSLYISHSRFIITVSPLFSVFLCWLLSLTSSPARQSNAPTARPQCARRSMRPLPNSTVWHSGPCSACLRRSMRKWRRCVARVL